MPAWMEGWPVLGIYLFFVLGAAARSQGLYWIGRGAAAGLLRSRWRDRLDSRPVHRAVASIERWGMPVVPLAFLTVGFQSAVFSAAGLLRLHWLRFTLWSVPGVLVWALVWAGGGMAAVAGGAALAARSPWALVAVVVALAALVTVAVLRRRRADERGHGARSQDAATGPATEGTQDAGLRS